MVSYAWLNTSATQPAPATPPPADVLAVRVPTPNLASQCLAAALRTLPDHWCQHFGSARTLIVVRSERTIKNTGQSSVESRYYLSSRDAGEHPAAHWLGLIRGHWGGVESRHHWRRDALLGEDGRRSRNATLLAHLAWRRTVLRQVMALELETQSLPQLRERLHSPPAHALKLLANS